MVQLVVSDPNQMSMLEWALTTKNIQYETVTTNAGEQLYGIPPPLLLVNGAPLDEYHALKWLETVDLVDIAQKKYPYLC